MNRAVTVRRVGFLILGVNLGLVVAKALVWYRTGSLAIGSEAVNSLTDAIYSAVVLAGLYLTTQPPDVDHPHGHERIEPLVSLFIAMAIFAAGGAILWGAARALYAGEIAVATGPAAAVVLVGAGAAKLGLYRYCLRVGNDYNSPALVAAGLDSRNDVLTVGAALIGVLGARAGYPVLDPLAAAVVSLGVFYTGWEVLRDNVDYLIGRAPPENLHAEIVKRTIAHPDVEGVHDVVAHYVGPEIDVSVHIEVEGDRTLLEAHGIETEIVRAVRELPEVDDVFVHIDPKELGEWKEDETADRLLEFDSEGEG
ncbi:cation diffusion facilitator family transporter [Halalkalicoccus jeotgali]|uniref:Cation efflux system protein n=1 Tax=Halalkalicoccus jeotgali (strain DSM 18796 / CECT 7217 / JCM 14584 / KCTC 4019 / B3) TaxID=795797 RepID=D8JAH2_HALJB|nr:cation diffusion facilitator family transporter [Halalkalicoccus jeotgali]ADJ14694.1 cation efflux system protein [Halalkalicoccus jeotgali B3]ELY39592.1 cation efflux system protein [Halalkalicoccus jeotgali B3]